MNCSLSEQSQWEFDSILPEECFACGLELLWAAQCHFNELQLTRACVNDFFMQGPHSQHTSERNTVFRNSGLSLLLTPSVYKNKKLP